MNYFSLNSESQFKFEIDQDNHHFIYLDECEDNSLNENKKTEVNQREVSIYTFNYELLFIEDL